MLNKMGIHFNVQMTTVLKMAGLNFEVSKVLKIIAIFKPHVFVIH
jgi:hypothetical protein